MFWDEFVELTENSIFFFLNNFVCFVNAGTTNDTWSMNDLLQLNALSTNNNHNNNSNKNLINPKHIQTNNSIIKKTDRLNKRPLNATNIDSIACTKRIKGELVGDVQQQSSPQPLQHHQYHQPSQQTAPQLLQQLMAPTPHKQRARAKANGGVGSACGGSICNKNDAAKWDMENTSHKQICGLNGQQQLQLLEQQQQQQQAASNSVLKNLLVSGCDISAGYICIVPMRSKKALKT